MQLINKEIDLKAFPNEYRKALSNRDAENDNSFNVKFQAKRKDLMENYFEFWNNLDKPYPFFEKLKHYQIVIFF